MRPLQGRYGEPRFSIDFGYATRLNQAQSIALFAIHTPRETSGFAVKRLQDRVVIESQDQPSGKARGLLLARLNIAKPVQVGQINADATGSYF